MNSSTEATFLHKVIENRTETAAEILHTDFLDGELIEFSEQLGTALDLVNGEIRAREARSRLAPADTGAINIIRGRE
jgi:hypothetical protein